MSPQYICIYLPSIYVWCPGSQLEANRLSLIATASTWTQEVHTVKCEKEAIVFCCCTSGGLVWCWLSAGGARECLLLQVYSRRTRAQTACLWMLWTSSTAWYSWEGNRLDHLSKTCPLHLSCVVRLCIKIVLRQSACSWQHVHSRLHAMCLLSGWSSSWLQNGCQVCLLLA